jgi:hypothetical protein
LGAKGFMFELAGRKSVSGGADRKCRYGAGYLLYLLGLRVAGDEVNGLVGEGGARPLLREPAVFELISAAAGGV